MSAIQMWYIHTYIHIIMPSPRPKNHQPSPTPLNCERSLNVNVNVFWTNRSKLSNTLYIALNPAQRFDKTGYCVCEKPSVTVHCSASTENGRSAVGSTWDLRPIGDRFESHPEGSVYSYHRHRVPIYVYVLTSRRVFRAFFVHFWLSCVEIWTGLIFNVDSTGSFFNVMPAGRPAWWKTITLAISRLI